MTSASGRSSDRQEPSYSAEEEGGPPRKQLRLYVVGQDETRDEAELSRLSARAQRMQALCDQMLKIKEKTLGHDVGTQTTLTGPILVGQLAIAYLHGYKTGLEDR